MAEESEAMSDTLVNSPNRMCSITMQASPSRLNRSTTARAAWVAGLCLSFLSTEGLAVPGSAPGTEDAPACGRDNICNVGQCSSDPDCPEDLPEQGNVPNGTARWNRRAAARVGDLPGQMFLDYFKKAVIGHPMIGSEVAYGFGW